MPFKKSVELVEKKVQSFIRSGKTLYEVQVDRDSIFELYLRTFEKSDDPIYKERTEHNCNTCKNFIRDIGNIVIINDDLSLDTIWNVQAPGPYGPVFQKMHEFISNVAIQNQLSVHTKKVGNKVTRQLLENGTVKEWEHFYAEVPNEYVQVQGETLSRNSSLHGVFFRGLEELKSEAIELVRELIDQNSLYRGEEHLPSIKEFQKFKSEFDKLTEKDKSTFCWRNLKSRSAGIRNTVIGTLLIDISEGLDLDQAVRKYEAMVAPANYKRPKALITDSMVKKAMETIDKLGIRESLERRYAVSEDISINNVLFADRKIKPQMKDALEDMLMKETRKKAPDFSKITEIQIEDFIKKVLPNADSISAFVENRHSGNLVSLIAPKHLDSPNILKWNNDFSWSYNGEVTDSMKERVKNAGGSVTGVLRFSIQWNEDGKDGSNDLDAHCKSPTHHHYYGSKYDGRTGGSLDIDITRPEQQVKDGIAVENITWPALSKMKDGVYQFYVHNYSGRNASGFRAQIEMNGEIHEFSYNMSVRERNEVKVADVTLKDGKFSIKNHIDSTTSSKEVWGIKTEDFNKVQIVTISPNHWDDQAIGNKHYFFMLEDCKNPDDARGLYNEFLKAELDKHRKVFEVLGAKIKCEYNTMQLSGVGFSSTKRDKLLVEVQGNFKGRYLINF